MVVALKYCGACNPMIDLAQIGRVVAELAREQGWQLVALGEDTKTDVLVLLCGCPRTCIDREEVRRQSKQVVLVAGKRLGWRTVPEKELPLAIIEAIKELSPQ
ncbi:hypothetical protein ACFLXO_08145 [Chloroflexota bacterium]